MIEFFLFALLALHGLACTTILALVLWRSARQRDHHSMVVVPEKLEPPDLPYPVLEGHPAEEIIAIMAECFPDGYETYVSGRLTAAGERELWIMCCAVHDARAEIEELCS